MVMEVVSEELDLCDRSRLCFRMVEVSWEKNCKVEVTIIGDALNMVGEMYDTYRT